MTLSIFDFCQPQLLGHVQQYNLISLDIPKCSNFLHCIKVEAPSADFSAPNSLSSTLKLLREILSSDEHAVAVPEDRESVCAQVG